MIACRTLSYALSHHLFHQAAELAHRTPGYRAVTNSFFNDNALARLRWLPARVQSLLARRSHAGIPPGVMRTYPVEHLYQFAARLAGRPYSYFAAHDRMARRILRDFDPPETVIAIDTGAETLFRAWRGRSRLILDLTIATAPYRTHVFTAAENAAEHRGIRFHHPGAWEISRYQAEVAMADLILCPSAFVMDSCRYLGASESKLRLLPYGFDPGRFAPGQPVDDRHYRIVFAGTFCHRKGSHLLVEAFTRFQADRPESELHVFGDIQDPPASCPPGMHLHGRVPQAELAERMRTMHVMAFPTLFEGSAYVTYQALASGVPVITTRNCGSVVDESCGIVLNAITASDLYDALVRCHSDRPYLARLAAAAPAKAHGYTWAAYGERLSRILSENPSPPAL